MDKSVNILIKEDFCISLFKNSITMATDFKVFTFQLNFVHHTVDKYIVIFFH